MNKLTPLVPLPHGSLNFRRNVKDYLIEIAALMQGAIMA